MHLCGIVFCYAVYSLIAVSAECECLCVVGIKHCVDGACCSTHGCGACRDRILKEGLAFIDIEVYLTVSVLVVSSHVEKELAVNEYPNVVVAHELEDSVHSLYSTVLVEHEGYLILYTESKVVSLCIGICHVVREEAFRGACLYSFLAQYSVVVLIELSALLVKVKACPISGVELVVGRILTQCVPYLVAESVFSKLYLIEWELDVFRDVAKIVVLS